MATPVLAEVIEVLEGIEDLAVVPLITGVAPVAPVAPVAAVPAPTPTEEIIWQCEVDGYHRRFTTLERNLGKLYSLIWLQCEPALRGKNRILTNYDALKESYDSIGMLKAIREVTFKFER